MNLAQRKFRIGRQQPRQPFSPVAHAKRTRPRHVCECPADKVYRRAFRVTFQYADLRAFPYFDYTLVGKKRQKRLPEGSAIVSEASIEGFNFSTAIEKVCRDMIVRLPEFAHIDFDRVAVSIVQARRDVSHGIYASLTPLRFEGGAREKAHTGTPLSRASGLRSPGA